MQRPIQDAMSLDLTPQTTALVLIDLEHGIVGRQLAPHTGKDVVERCATLASALRSAGGAVVYVHVLLHEIVRHSADKPTTSAGAPPPPPAASELVPEAGFQPGDILVTKRQWGAFYGTSLEQHLRRRGVTTIILGGIATNFGVESTARAAFDQGYKLVFAEDAMSTMSADMHRFSTETLFPIMGHVRSTAEIIAALNG